MSLERKKRYRVKIKIKYFTDKVQKLEKIAKGNWIDLRAAENIVMKKGEFKLIPLGIAVELPRGYGRMSCQGVLLLKISD